MRKIFETILAAEAAALEKPDPRPWRKLIDVKEIEWQSWEDRFACLDTTVPPSGNPAEPPSGYQREALGLGIPEIK